MILHAFIRRVLSEAMKGAEDLPDGHYVTIDAMGGDIMVSIWQQDVIKPLGTLVMHRASLGGDGGIGDGTWVVTTSRANKGWGPLMYDVAMEWATMHGSGLTCDRETVSDAAYHIWDYYMNSRSDVKSYQLDTRKSLLTPSKSDDIGQMSTSTHLDKFEKEVNVDDLMGSPLARRYIKAPTQINSLKKLDKLRMGE